MGRIRAIQILRAVAILGVLVLHALERWQVATRIPLSPSAHIGAYGVDLFFVISGFIVCTVARRAPSATDFLRSRYLRVAPLYYLLTIPWLPVMAALGQLMPAGIMTSLFFWPVWGTNPTYPVLTSGWTLCFEALFYCSLGAVIRFGRPAALALLIGYAAALALNIVGVKGALQFIGSPLILEFLLGAAITLRPIRARPRAGLAAVLAACVLLAFWFVCGIGETPSGFRAYDSLATLPRVGVAGPPAFLLVWGGLQLEPWCKGRLVDAVSYIGDASFSIYLLHYLAILKAESVWASAGLPSAGAQIFAFVFALGSGVLVYRTVERPLLAFLRRKPQPLAMAAE